MLHASDQAAGLRRLFRRAPSAVVALFTSGRAPRQLAVRTLMALTEGARRVVAIDEHAPEHGSLLAAFGYPEGGDLLGALEGRMDVTETMREVADGLWVVPAAATVQSVALLGDAHHARLEAGIAELQRRADLQDPPVAQDGDAVGQRQRLVLIVRDEQRGDVLLFLDTPDFVAHGDPGLASRRRAASHIDAPTVLLVMEHDGFVAAGGPPRAHGEVRK